MTNKFIRLVFAVLVVLSTGCAGIAADEKSAGEPTCSIQLVTHPAAYCDSDQFSVMKCGAPIENPSPGECVLPSAGSGKTSDVWCCNGDTPTSAVIVSNSEDAPIASGYGRIVLTVYPGQCSAGSPISIGVGDVFYHRYQCDNKPFDVVLDIAVGYPAAITTTVSGNFTEWHRTITPVVSSGSYQRIDQLVLVGPENAPGSFTEYDSEPSKL